MRKIRKVVALIFIFSLLVPILVACNNIDNQTAGNKILTGENGSLQEDERWKVASEDKRDPVILTTVSMHGGTDANAINYQAIIEEFSKKFEYITIEDDSQASNQDWKAKIAADFAVGNEPDVIQYFTDANASDVLAADKFVTIEEIREVYPEYAADTFKEALERAANPDGVQRAVPTTGYWEGLFCNKDLFDQYEVELPTDWDKFLKAIKIFKANGIIPVSVSLSEVPHYWVENLLLAQAGPESYSSVPKTAPGDWIKGLEMIKTLKDMGAFPEDADSIDNAYASSLFYEKKAAMQLDGSWFIGGVPDQENTVVCAFPVMNGGKAPVGSMVCGISSGFYITKKAWNDPHKRDAAVKFVTAHTGKEAVQKYWGGAGQPACDVDPIEGMTPLALSGMNYSNSAVSIFAPTDSRILPKAYNILVAGIVEVAAGDKSAEDLLNEVLNINSK